MRRALLCLALLLLPALVLAQSDPRLGTPTTMVDATTTTVTSSPFAVIVSSVNETILFQLTTPDAAVATVVVEGSLGPEADVKADSATWSTIFTTTQLNVFLYLEDPPAYIRVTVTPTSGTTSVFVRGPGTRFREVEVP